MIFLAKNNAPPFDTEDVITDVYVTDQKEGRLSTGINFVYVVVKEQCLETLELRAEQDNNIGATLWIADVTSTNLSELQWTKKLVFHDIQAPVGWWTHLIAYKWDILLDEKFNKGYGKGRVNIYVHEKEC